MTTTTSSSSSQATRLPPDAFRPASERSGRAAALRRLLESTLDIVLPNACAACRQPVDGFGRSLCGPCAATICADRDRNYCGRCGRTLAALAIRERDCAGCGTERFWNVRRVVRVGTYSQPLRRLLVGLKFYRGSRNANVAGKLLADELGRQIWIHEIDCLVPVPMHRLRRLQRPCDHARTLAEQVGRRLGIPVLRAVRRPRYTPSQMRFPSRAARFENVAGCFKAVRRPRVEGRTVCIIDNLIVTGATVHEMSKVLRRAGAVRVYAAVVARSVPPGDSQWGPIFADPAEPL
jgi:ComF family protein